MPQMDILTFSSQNFWLLVTFVIVFGLVNGPIILSTHRMLSFVKKINSVSTSNNKLSFQKKSLDWNFLK